MTNPSTPVDDQAMGLRTAPAAADAPVAGGELDRLERELRADPWCVVRRACQLADYENFVPDDEPGKPPVP